MQVIRAATAGFCMGVSLALRRLDKELEACSQGLDEPGGCNRLLTFGPIIHNPLVMAQYAEKGVASEENAEALGPGDRVVIRAHGIPREVEAKLRDRGVFVIDATCPKVKKAQLAIRRESAHGRMLLLFGEREHPEVRGLLSYAEHGARVFTHPDEVASIPLSDTGDYFLAAQTTQDRGLFEKTAELLEAMLPGRLAILDTICDATRQRQKETIELARRVEMVVVVGGLNSGNTRRLAEIVRAEGIPAVHVEQASDLRREDLSGVSLVGLTAGASTPEEHIDAVQRFLEAL